MKSKIKAILLATLIIISVCFIAWAVGLVIPRYLFVAVLLLYGIYLIYRMLNPKKRYYFVSYVHAKGFGVSILWTQGYLIRKEAEAFINQEYFEGKDSIAILYYREISKDEYDAQRKGLKMTESEILSKLKSGDKFTGHNGAFTGIVAPLSFHGDNMMVECRKDGCTWKEDWDVLTTVWGFGRGDYEFIKEE